jgi:RHS repeat-associated protein
VGVTDAAGALEAEYTYTPFGETTAAGSASANSLQFTGRENDNSGLYYYRARYYDPRTSRFVSEDPLQWEGGGRTVFEYARTNPVNFSDPTGLSAWDCLKCLWKRIGDCSKSSQQCEKDLAKKYPNPLDLCYSKDPPYNSPTAAVWDICFFNNPDCQKAVNDCVKCASGPIKGPNRL